jgi:hypothetical protein
VVSCNHRQVIDTIPWELRTGATCPTATAPERPPTNACAGGPPPGPWDRILDKAIVEDDSGGAVEWTIGVDSSHVRGPPAGCGGPEKGSCRDGVEALVVEGKPSDTPVADGP